MEFELADALTLLERTPGTLKSLLQGLPAPWSEHSPHSHAWTVREIIGHLIHGERTDWWPRLETILAGDPHAVFEPFDRSAHLGEGSRASPEALLETFRELRTRNLSRLRERVLTAADFERTARHPALGTVTLRELLATWVVHDLTHVAQAARTLATRYKDEVGPWYHRDYLRTLVADAEPR